MVHTAFFLIIFFFYAPLLSEGDNFRPYATIASTSSYSNASSFNHDAQMCPVNVNQRDSCKGESWRLSQDWQNHFDANQMTEHAVLSDIQGLLNYNYRAAAKKLPLYSVYIKKHAQQFARYGLRKRGKAWWDNGCTWGIKKKLNALHRECEQEQEKRRQEEKRARAVAYRKQEEAIRREQQEREQIIYQELRSRVKNQAISVGCPAYARQQARSQALERTFQEGMKRMARTFECDVRARSFADSYGIELEALEGAKMNAYQYQLQTECVEQLSIAAGLHDRCSTNHRVSIFLDAVGDSVGQSVLANQSNQVEIATTWTDMGWQALDIAQATVEGVWLGTTNVAAIVLHPIHTGQSMIHGVATMANLLARATGTVANLAYLEFKGDHDQVCSQLDDLVSALDRQIDHCRKEFDRIPNREKVKYATAFATELILPAKALSVASGIASRMRPLIVECIEVMRKEEMVVELAGTGQKILMHASEGTQQALGGVAQITSDTRLVLERFHVNLMKNLESEMVALRSSFDNTRKGFGEFANKYIKLAYEHVLGMELSFDRKGMPVLSGFHHDFMNAIENNGLVEFANKVVDKYGVYKADLVMSGRRFPDKTFFPSSWTRKQVASAIHEAYDDFLSKGIIPPVGKNGKYFIKGWTKEGMEIHMYMTKNGKMPTAYPKMRN